MYISWEYKLNGILYQTVERKDVNCKIFLEKIEMSFEYILLLKVPTAKILKTTIYGTLLYFY